MSDKRISDGPISDNVTTYPRPPFFFEFGDVVPLPWGEEGAESDIPPTMPEVCSSERFPKPTASNPLPLPPPVTTLSVVAEVAGAVAALHTALAAASAWAFSFFNLSASAT